MKYTIKELLDKVWDKDNFLRKYCDCFTNDDIDYAISKDTSDDLYYTIYFFHSKFNRTNIINVINTGKIEWIINKRNLWDRELVKLLIPKIKNLNELTGTKHYLNEFFDEETEKLYKEQYDKLSIE